MLDEATSDTDVIHLPDANAPKMRVEPAGPFFGPVLPKDGEKPLSGADSSAPAPNATSAEIKVQPGDFIRGPVPAKDGEKVSTPKSTHFFIRLLQYGARGAVVAFLCGLAWAGGAYYTLGHSPFVLTQPSPALGTQQSPQHDEMLGAMQQMTAEIRGLKASADGRSLTQNAGADQRPNAAQATTGAMITDLAGRVDKLDAELTTKLNQVDERLAGIEQKIAASHAALVARATPHKHPKPLHDAFDPSQDPNAPGAPHPLDTGSGEPSRF